MSSRGLKTEIWKGPKFYAGTKKNYIVFYTFFAYIFLLIVEKKCKEVEVAMPLILQLLCTIVCRFFNTKLCKKYNTQSLHIFFAPQTTPREGIRMPFCNL